MVILGYLFWKNSSRSPTSQVSMALTLQTHARQTHDAISNRVFWSPPRPLRKNPLFQKGRGGELECEERATIQVHLCHGKRAVVLARNGERQ